MRKAGIVSFKESQDKATVIDCYVFDLRLNDGTSFHIECGRTEIDKLIELIGEQNITDIEEL